MADTSNRDIQDSHLDVYLNGIRENFNRLNRELDEARNQRDEYKQNYTNQAKELQELRKIVVGSGKGVCPHCQSSGISNDGHSPILSPASSYFSIEEDESISARPYNSTRQEIHEEHRGGNLQQNYIANENEIRNHSTSSGNSLLSHESPVSSVSLPGASTWNIDFSNTEVALKLNRVHTLTQNTLRTYAAFSMDGKYLATVSETGIVHIFDVKTGKRLSAMRDLYKFGEDKPATYRCLGISADSKFLATGQTYGDVKIWIVSQRRVRNTFKHQGTVRGVDFSPNGESIAIASEQTVVIRRLRDGFSRILKQTDLIYPWTVRFSRDGRYVASGGNPQDNRIRILDVRMGECIARHGGHNDVVRGLVFTPDGKGLLSASWDNMVIHWDVSWLKPTHGADSHKVLSTRSLTEISRLVGHKDYAYAVSISPDGNWIASGSWDRTVRIWNAHTATLQCILHGHGQVVSVDFSRIGNYLAVADGDGRVTIWNYTDLESPLYSDTLMLNC